MTGRKFIFRVASDSDCEKEHGRMPLLARPPAVRLRPATRRPGRGADRGRRRTCCNENHGLESSVVNMLVEPPRRMRRRRSTRTSTCCGSSNLRALKRPELVLELARQLPHVKFTLAGGPLPQPSGRTYFEDVKAAAARLPNVVDARRRALYGLRRAGSIAPGSSSTPRASRDSRTPFCRPGSAACRWSASSIRTA